MQDLTSRLEAVRKSVVPVVSFGSDYFTRRGPFLSAAIAFYAFMSLFPLTIGSIALMHLLFGHSHFDEAIAETLVENIPVLDQGAGPSFIEAFITEAAAQPAVTTGVSGLVMFISAFGVFGAVRESVNIMWGAERRPSFFMQRITEGAMLVIGSVLLFTSLVVTTVISFVGTIREFFLEGTGYIDHWSIDVVGFVIAFVINFAVFTAHYRWLPHAEIKLVEVLPASMITALVFEIVKFAFILYLHNGAERFLTIYGSVANLMMLFLFFFAQANILLVGAMLSSRWIAFTRSRRTRLAGAVSA